MVGPRCMPRPWWPSMDKASIGMTLAIGIAIGAFGFLFLLKGSEAKETD